MKEIYDNHAEQWKRDSPKHYSDFCGRPQLFDTIVDWGEVDLALDLGCGEGYISRKMTAIAKKVIGVDSSEKMIALAKDQEAERAKGIEYHVADMRSMPFIPDGSVDLCVASYSLNYLHPDNLPEFYTEMGRVMNPRGKFVVLIPHPAWAISGDFGEAIQFEGSERYSYKGSRGEFFPAKVKSVDGEVIDVGLIHSTVDDHFKGISEAGLMVSGMQEPVFSQEIAFQHPIFKKLAGKCNSLILEGIKLP